MLPVRGISIGVRLAGDRRRYPSMYRSATSGAIAVSGVSRDNHRFGSEPFKYGTEKMLCFVNIVFL